MSILWCGGEDVDFQGANPVTVNTTSTTFRSGYARCSVNIQTSGATAISNPFQSGAITSCWFTFRAVPNNAGISYQRFAGLVNSATPSKGIFIGASAASGTVICLCKFDGTTTTELATGGAVASGVQTRVDVHLVNYGASSTITVYANGSPVINFSGNSSISGVSNFDCFCISGTAAFFWNLSEFIVADEDTRALALVTMAPTSLGTTDQWTGAVTDVNETTNSDSTVVVTNTVAQDEQFNITDFPTGSFSVKVLKIAARSVIPTGSTPTSLKLGVNSGGTVDVDSGTAVGSGGQTVERFMATNPITSAAWQQSEMNALQMNLRSA